jgi:uncharacterized protein YprB with RNaseH-like and TPR domain
VANKKIQDNELRQALDSGLSVRDIAEEFEVDPSTIYKRASKLGLKNQDQLEAEEKVPAVVAGLRDQINEEFKLTSKTQLDFVSFDIETTNLTADFSTILCACIKPFGKDSIVFRIDDYNKDWSSKRKDDSKIVKAIAEELSKHAIIITHYGSKFDIPYLKAKMVKYGLSPLPPMFAIDTWRISKNNFQVSSRKLVSLSQYFNLGVKSGVEGDLWLEASMNGNTKALDEIVKHNIQDVILLEKLSAISFPYLKSIPKA